MRKEPLRQSNQLHTKLRSISPQNTVSLSRGSPGNPTTAAADNASFSPPRDLGGGEKKKKRLCIPEVGAQRASSESEKIKTERGKRGSWGVFQRREERSCGGSV